jgi:DNA-binding XRE family transcriptional regulator
MTKLDKYLRMYRKRADLSQDEVAYFLSVRSETQASRHERFHRVPNLDTALACEAIFGILVRELFAGRYERAEREVRRRARYLRQRMPSERVRRPKIFSAVGRDNHEQQLPA